jgi:hypothetical protein
MTAFFQAMTQKLKIKHPVIQWATVKRMIAAPLTE